MTTIMFETRFVPDIESGKKIRTIRQKRKRPIKPGDGLSLRCWTGKPYRSKQYVIALVRCTRVATIRIDSGTMQVDGKWLDRYQIEQVAWKDGFSNATQLRIYLTDAYGLPFEGELIEWEEA